MSEPTITIPLSKLKAVVQESLAHEELKELKELIVERERELYAPAPRPWDIVKQNWVAVKGQPAFVTYYLVDARSHPLSERDARRAAMAPELAKALQNLLGNECFQSTLPLDEKLKKAKKALALFDNPSK